MNEKIITYGGSKISVYYDKLEYDINITDIVIRDINPFTGQLNLVSIYEILDGLDVINKIKNSTTWG